MNSANPTNTNDAIQKSTNNVLLKGTIVHKFVTPDVAILTINTGKSTPVVNFPKVLFFGDLRSEVEEKYDMGDHVTVTGNIQSSKRKETIKNQIMQSVFAESISETESLMEKAFGICTDSSYKTYENSFNIAGEVMSLDCPTDSMVRMTIRTYKNNRVSFARYVYYTTDVESVLSAVHPKDWIYAVGCIQTNKVHRKNGETQYFQNYVLTEIAKM